MKKILRFMGAAILAAGLFATQGCLKDSCRKSYTIYKPIYKSLTEVRAGMKSRAPQPLQKTGKLNVFGNYIFLNEVNKGFHVIDNANPASPKNIGFVPIPNNIDIAVKGSYLYADSYSDIIVFDISSPSNITAIKFMNNVMKEKNVYWQTNVTNTDAVNIVTGYSQKDTIVDCATYNSWRSCPNCSFDASSGTGFYAAAPQQTGTGGSMASFTIITDYLYTVGSSSLYAINISNPSNPQQAAVKNLGWGIETIYPFQNKLFIGSRTGMFIYGLTDPANPTMLSRFSHATVCDPVIADGNYAYVTLRSGTTCAGPLNELNVLDITNLANPVLQKRQPMINPHGLSKDGGLLFICDGTDGLKIYDAASPTSPTLKKQITGIETYDVIAMNNRAIVVAKDGLYQYDYSNRDNITLLSKLSIAKN